MSNLQENLFAFWYGQWKDLRFLQIHVFKNHYLTVELASDYRLIVCFRQLQVTLFKGKWGFLFICIYS